MSESTIVKYEVVGILKRNDSSSGGWDITNGDYCYSIEKIMMDANTIFSLEENRIKLTIEYIMEKKK